MIIDTDVLILYLRGNIKAATAIESITARQISIITQMELMQGCRSKAEAKNLKAFFKDLEFSILPINENISHLAATFVEDFSLSHDLQISDALIAATAKYSGETLLTGNVKHFKYLPNVDVKTFKA